MQEQKIFKRSTHPVPQLGEQEEDQALTTSIQVNQESPHGTALQSAFAFHHWFALLCNYRPYHLRFLKLMPRDRVGNSTATASRQHVNMI